MLSKEQIDRLLSQGGSILSQDGEKIGSIGEVFVDNENDQPSWVTVKTGLFGMSESFVPLEGARTEDNDIVVPYSKDQVKDAPRMDADRPLEPAEVDRLYEHYQLGSKRTYTEATTGNAGFTDAAGRTRDDAAATGAPGRATDDAAATAAPGRAAAGAGYDTSGRTTDDDAALTDSGKRPGATEEQVTGRGRLRRYVTTENVTKTVPVQREEVRIEREPITDENRDEALSGPDGDEHEVILHEERLIVEKETVPVERVRIGTETVTDEVTVDEVVRKEHFDADGPEESRG